jgi:signal transduction histidine kinase
LELFAQLTTAVAESIEYFLLQEENRVKAGLFSQVLEDLPLPVLILNDKKKIMYTNQNAHEKFGNDFESMFADQQIDSWIGSKTAAASLEQEMDGTHFQVAGRRLSDGGGTDMFALVFSSDTEMHNKQSYLTLLMDTISHDFKVPLVNMQGFSKLMSMVGELNPKQEEYLASIRAGMQEISAVVEDLSDIGRIVKDEGLRVAECSAKETIEKAVNLVQAEARQKRLNIERLLLDEDRKIVIDQVLVVSALYNLMTNAVKHSRIGGVISIEEKVEGNDWIVSVIDCGKGMSQIDIEKMENDHFVSKEGQGLSIVERIARIHRGRLSIESELGKGSKFILQLPCFE